VVIAGAIINLNSNLGRGRNINTCSSVDHDCIFGEFCHLAVGAHMCGTVKVGDSVWICAGELVIKDIYISGIYIGVLVKKENETFKF
jgi:acetyltransferase-like isoleucine patch superfamily enzyme